MIRRAKFEDQDPVWNIFHAVIQTEETYVNRADTARTELSNLWFAPHMHTFVYDEKGSILGSYIIKANQIDLGNHIANASYMVHPSAQGRGIGRQLCEHSINQARKLGFVGMQFNIVVSTNLQAIHLWKSFGFEIIGTTPKAFRHPKLGFVDTHIMYKEL